MHLHMKTIWLGSKASEGIFSTRVNETLAGQGLGLPTCVDKQHNETATKHKQN